MMLQKWDVASRRYRPYQVPDSWEVSTYETDLNKEINCAQCGCEISYGKTYTSREVHTEAGFGYCVCEDCYQAEMKRERAAEARI